MTSTEVRTTEETTMDRERADLLQILATRRHFLRHTAQGLTDEQAGLRPTASELCIGGLVKHVTLVEAGWAAFMSGGAERMAAANEHTDWLGQFRMQPGETLAAVLERYAEVAARTDELVRTLPSLDAAHPLPEAPWFEPGASWSARQVVLHIVGETAQHAGHADILRETIDGQKSMG
ncbi:DinB family protein [Goekera deserti]|nr:DinB family protein [Goekera deserti]